MEKADKDYAVELILPIVTAKCSAASFTPRCWSSISYITKRRILMNSFEALQSILKIITVGPWSVEEGVPHLSFGIGPESLNIIGGEDVLDFNKLINFLHSSDRDISRSYSRKTFLTKLVNYIGPIKLQAESPTQENLRAFYSELRTVEMKKFRVIREIFGITLSTNDVKLSLGCFKIYHFPSHREEFKKTLGPVFQVMTMPHEPTYVIEYEVESREQVRAVEIADDAFKKFVLYLRHIIGTSDQRFEVGILDYHGWRGRSAHVIHGTQYFGNAERYGSFEPIPIDNAYFVSTESGFNKIWGFLGSPNISKLQKRICTAIEWVGRSLLEPSIQPAFIEASVAIESIFTHNEKTIITPSILSQISESVALIVGSSPEERITIESQIKALYGIRSGIVHAGDKEVAPGDYNLFVQYIRIVIAKLLTVDALIKCNSVEELYAHLKNQKYS